MLSILGSFICTAKFKEIVGMSQSVAKFRKTFEHWIRSGFFNRKPLVGSRARIVFYRLPWAIGPSAYRLPAWVYARHVAKHPWFCEETESIPVINGQRSKQDIDFLNSRAEIVLWSKGAVICTKRAPWHNFFHDDRRSKYHSKHDHRICSCSSQCENSALRRSETITFLSQLCSKNIAPPIHQ